MTRPAIAVVTGFTKCEELLQKSFAPLLELKRRKVLDRIVYVTWDSGSLDAYIEPARTPEGVELIRVPEPDVSGTPQRRGVAYQVHNLAEALAQIPEDDALVVKLRPDFIFDEGFLESKIANFDSLCAPSRLGEQFGVAMPPSPFAAKIWLPWADANIPLHYEDATFIGLKRDVAKFADPRVLSYLDSPILSGRRYGWLVHASRFATMFSDYPIFHNHLRNFQFLPLDRSFRMPAMATIIKEPFFWRLLIANAWVMAANFHIDCGAQNRLRFYCNGDNPDADWSALRKLKIHPPYHAVDEWRSAQAPGGLLPNVGRIYARLVDDSWQHALFTGADLRDVTAETLRSMLNVVRAYDPNVPDPAEAAYLRTIARAYGAYQDMLAPAPA